MIFGGQHAVHDHGVHAVAEQPQVRVRPPRLADHHLLEVHHETHRRHLLVGEDLLDRVKVRVQPLHRREDVVARDRHRRHPGHDRTHGLHDLALHGPDALDVPVHDLGQGEQPERLGGGGAVHDQDVVVAALHVRLHVDQREDLVEPGDHRQLFGLDRLGARPVHQRDGVLLDLAPVVLQPLLRVDLLGPEVRDHLRRPCADRRLERVRQRVGGVGRHDHRPSPGRCGPHGGRRGHGGLPDPALPGEQHAPAWRPAYPGPSSEGEGSAVSEGARRPTTRFTNACDTIRRDEGAAPLVDRRVDHARREQGRHLNGLPVDHGEHRRRCRRRDPEPEPSPQAPEQEARGRRSPRRRRGQDEREQGVGTTHAAPATVRGSGSSAVPRPLTAG